MGRCPNLTRTLPKLPRDPNKSNDVKQKGVEDHAPEALRYGCMAIFDLSLPIPQEPEHPQPTRVDPYWDKLQKYLAGQDGLGGSMPGFGPGW